MPREARGDALTDARLNERRYLTREYWAADSPEARLRVQQDMAVLDHELARVGYPVHELERLPEPPAEHGTGQHAAEPETQGDGRDHSTHDEIWNDPPWEREGRRLALEDVIPSSHEEAAKWEPQIRDAIARELEGREFAGMRVRLSIMSDKPVSAYLDAVSVRLDIVHPERGMVGRIVRGFERDYDGSLRVVHTSLHLSEDLQGSGFAREWNGYMEDWYRYSGVDHIEVHAASTVGGYAWARDGYDWAPGSEYLADRVFGRLRVEMRVIADHADQVQRFLAGDRSVDIDALRQRYRIQSPEELRAELTRQYDAGQDILDRAARYPFGRPGYPSPLDVSRAGWNGERGHEATWLGKRAMLGAEWRGVKPISEGGPTFPRSAHFPADLSGDPSIHAWKVPGGEFGGHGTEPSQLHRQALMDATPEALTRVVSEHGGLTLVGREGNQYEIGLADHGSFTVRIETQWLGVDAAAETHLNHDSGRHVIQLSDQLGVEHVERALAHEVGEIVEDRARYLRDEVGERPDTLRPGAFVSDSKLSPHDAGRIQELRVLGRQLDEMPPEGSRTPEQELEYQRPHREALALVDHLGLREGDQGAGDRRQLVFDRVDPLTRARIDTLLRDAGRAEHEMSPADRAALAEVRIRASLDQARLDALRDALTAPDRPIALGGRHVTLDEARRLADQAAEARTQRGAQTLHDLREQQARLGPGEYPKVRLQLGGGASLAGRDPHALLVDERGRWQADNGSRIAQTADQLRNLNRTGLGDPYQFVDVPGQRVPLEAVRYWEDSVAARGPVIDGEATLHVDEHGRLLVDITPQHGGPALTLEVDGRPVITTGFPPEIVPGVDRRVGMRDTFSDLSAALDALGTPEALWAKDAVDALSWYRADSARLALKALTDQGVDPGSVRPRTLKSLQAIDRWNDARKLAPGERPRVLFGDEANLSEVDGVRMDPAAARKWVVAGAGGTGISGVENMLRATDVLPQADRPEFVMVGTRPPAGLGDNPQWHQVRATYDQGYDPRNPYESSRRLPSGEWPNPDPPGGARLTMVLDTEITDFSVKPTPGAEYAVLGIDRDGNAVSVAGDGLIASLGGRPGVPPAIAEMVDAAMRRDPASVTGELLFDNGGQYLGYRLTVDGRVIDVTGAASRFLPPSIFEQRPGHGPMHPASELDDAQVWSTPDRRFVVAQRDPNAILPQETAALRDAPPESGNFDGGYVATAVQVNHYAAFARDGAPPPVDPTHVTPTDPGSGHPPATGGSAHGGHFGGGRLVRPTDLLDTDVQSRWAAHAYELFRADHTDVAEIAAHLAARAARGRRGSASASRRSSGSAVRTRGSAPAGGLRRSRQGDRTVVRQFDPDADMAEAWIRLRSGEPLPSELTLLEHELREAGTARRTRSVVRQAHTSTPTTGSIGVEDPRADRRDLALWEHQDGHTAAFPEGPGDGHGGGVPVAGYPEMERQLTIDKTDRRYRVADERRTTRAGRYWHGSRPGRRRREPGRAGKRSSPDGAALEAFRAHQLELPRPGGRRARTVRARRLLRPHRGGPGRPGDRDAARGVPFEPAAAAGDTGRTCSVAARGGRRPRGAHLAGAARRPGGRRGSTRPWRARSATRPGEVAAEGRSRRFGLLRRLRRAGRADQRRRVRPARTAVRAATWQRSANSRRCPGCGTTSSGRAAFEWVEPGGRPVRRTVRAAGRDARR